MLLRVAMHSTFLQTVLQSAFINESEVDLSDCFYLTWEALYWFICNLKLKSLSLSKMSEFVINDKNLLLLVKLQSNLEFLDLSYCNVTPSSVLQLETILPKLSVTHMLPKMFIV
jgi:hypothetical protein